MVQIGLGQPNSHGKQRLAIQSRTLNPGTGDHVTTFVQLVVVGSGRGYHSRGRPQEQNGSLHYSDRNRSSSNPLGS